MFARPNCLGIPVLLLILIATPAMASDWITASSYYTHDYKTGERVNQFAKPRVVQHTPMYSSVYRHRRSSLQVGDSIDQYHRVDQYGDVVRPYGEWRFPYRPFSVPYPLWGPQPPVYVGGGYGGFGVGGAVPFGGGGGPYGPAGVVNGAGFPPPWNDGSYPDVRRTQLPPQPFPSPTTTINNNNDINGNNNVINNNP